MLKNRKKDIRLLIVVILISIATGIFSYQPLWRSQSKFRPWTFGLDIAGGTSLIYEVDLSEVTESDRNSVMSGLRDVIEKRVNLFGVSEPRVTIQKNQNKNRLMVELAGIKNVSDAIKEIGATPFLDFREVELKEKAGEVSLNNEKTTEPSFTATDLNGRYVKSATLSLESVSQKPVVNIEFTGDGAKIFGKITEKNVGKPLAIFLDNQLIEMPVIKEKISGGRAVISGNFTADTAKQLVERFNAGALPAPITLINQYTVSPELGADSLNRAVLAGVLGTILIMIFMIAYYGELGLFAVIALAMYVSITLGTFKIMPITMTLAGIAGFILSIGMAVDANILVFERTKEEIRRGRSTENAIEEGFKRAWTSIRDSNISTILTAIVLYYFTSSFVRGFALTLLIGVLVSMFSAITITRTLLRLFLKIKK